MEHTVRILTESNHTTSLCIGASISIITMTTQTIHNTSPANRQAETSKHKICIPERERDVTNHLTIGSICCIHLSTEHTKNCICKKNEPNNKNFFNKKRKERKCSVISRDLFVDISLYQN